jgi:hypothetical protein
MTLSFPIRSFDTSALCSFHSPNRVAVFNDPVFFTASIEQNVQKCPQNNQNNTRKGYVLRV